MNFVHIEPSPPLNQFIKCFWILEKDYSKTGGYETVYPDGHLDLIFSFSENNVSAFFSGQQTTTTKISQPDKVKFIAIEFFPFGAFPFFNTPMDEFTNTITSPTDIFGNDFKEISEKVFLAPDNKGIQIIEAFLLKKLGISKISIAQIEAAAKLLYVREGAIPIDQLANAVNLTKRTLERKFEITTGLTPKVLARVFRFNKIKNELMRNPYTSLTSLAYRFKYFDQSHFIHDFKQFTGYSPALFANEVINKQIYFNRQ